MEFFKRFVNTELGALWVMFMSAIIYSIQGVFTKLAHDDGNGFSDGEMMLVRAGIQAFVCVMGLRRRSSPLPLFGPRGIRHMVWFRGIFGSVGFICYYHTLVSLPLGDAIALVSMYPIFTVFIAWAVVGEKTVFLHLMALMCSIIGTMFIAQPPFLFDNSEFWTDDEMEKIDSSGYVTAFLGSFFTGTVFIFIRQAKAAHPLQLMNTFSICGFIGGFILASIEGMKFNGNFGYLFLVCLFAIPGHFMMNFAGRLAPSGVSSIVRSSDVIWAYMFQTFFFDMPVNPWTIIGVMCALTGIWLVGISKMSCCSSKSIAFETLENDGDLESEELELGELDDAKSAKSVSTLSPRETSALTEASAKMRAKDQNGGGTDAYDPFNDYNPYMDLQLDSDSVEIGDGASASEI